ncbi:MAG: rhodanese-like domain-containing protein [Firmicutes bacterium]|nr:rhodanese-like domain-containing protein [Bacillota bacterium]
MFGFGPKIPEMTPQELEQHIKDRAVFVLDVRTVAEFRQAHIPQAYHIPLGELPHRLHEVPADRPVVTVCRSGSRSRMAAQHLQKAGYTVHNLQGGMLQWKGPVR